MRKGFKRLLCTAFILPLIGSASAINTSAYRIGDVIGKVLSTDIVTYVEGVRVASYNIKGRTAVVAQDLNKLGTGLNFGVIFDEASRVLSITNRDENGYGSQEQLVYQESGKKKPVGTPVENVLYTDITANFEGNQLESFNIRGYTCIYADDLGKLCGTYVWDENARTVKVFRTGAYVPHIDAVDSIHKLPAQDSVINRDFTTERWGESEKSYLVQNSDGTLCAVEIDEHINLETYDSSFNHISSFAIAKELPLFGGLYFGKEYNYIATGQENLSEDNAREVIRISVYNKSFAKIRDISITNCKTAVPFDASNADMCEDDNYLILHTSRSQYLDENNSRPQTQLTVIIDKKTWQVTNILGKFQYNHTSHALKEYVAMDGGRIITANYSDAAPLRGAFLQEIDSHGMLLYTRSIFGVGGALAANCTGAMIGGLEVSDTGYLVTVSSIDHTLPTYYSNVNIGGIERENRNIFLLWTDKNTWEIKQTPLAAYSSANLTGSVPYIVKLKNGNFMVLWQQFTDAQESETMCYTFVDGSGNKLTPSYTASGRLSKGCQPIEVDGKVMWYVNSSRGRTFYSVSGKLPQTNQQTNQNTNQNQNTEVEGL